MRLSVIGDPVKTIFDFTGFQTLFGLGTELKNRNNPKTIGGDGEVSLLHRKRAATDRFFLFRMTKPGGVTLTGEMCLWEDETPIGTGLPMLFDFLNEVRISK